MTGLLGGTFDPPHYGHLVLAMEAFSRFDLEEVLLVPARFPPHKHGEKVSEFSHRLRMAELAVMDAPELRAEDLEPPDGPSWTVNLVRKLRDDGLEICFIMGMDSLEELHTWKDPVLIGEIARMVAGARPGHSPDSVPPELLEMVEVFRMPEICVSSSELRRRFARGFNTRYLLPDAVRDYILEQELYARSQSHR